MAEFATAEVSGHLSIASGDRSSSPPGLSVHVVAAFGRYPYQPLATFRSEDYPRNWGQARRIAAARAAAEADCARRNAEYDAWLAEPLPGPGEPRPDWQRAGLLRAEKPANDEHSFGL